MFHLPTLLCLVVVASSAVASQPNIVFLLADDLGYNDVGYHNPAIISPNIDLLASQGVVLEQSYVQPVCSPTRSALLTGTYPFRMGRQNGPIGDNQPTGLTLDKTLLPEYLKNKGYDTHMIGKWHLGFCKREYLPTNRGFDSHYGYWSGAEDYYTKMIGPPNHQGYDFYDGEDVDRSAAGTYSTELYTDRAKSIIATHAAKAGEHPLFLYVAYQATHTPLAAPQKFQDLYPDMKDQDRMMFSAAASALDESVGEITRALVDHGLYDNTVIVFMGDNGGQTGNHGGGNNYPLRGMKGTTWEGGVRTPAFIHSPLLGAGGVSVDQLIHVTDWLPTFMKAAGATDEEIAAMEMDGIDHWDIMKDPENFISRREDMVLNMRDAPQGNHGPKGAYRKGEYKIVVHPSGQDGWIEPPTADNNYSTITHSNINATRAKPQMFYLFNIKDDPEEREDLSQSDHQVLQDMREAFESIHDEMAPADDPEDGSGGLQDGVWVTGWC